MLSCSIWFSAPSFWMGGGLESRCVGSVCGADGAVDGTTCTVHRKPYAATQHLMLLMMGVCTRNMLSQEHINNITLLHPVGISHYFMRKMHGQTTLKSEHVFIADADYSQHSFRVRVWAYKSSSPLNYMLFQFKHFTLNLVAIFPSTKRHIVTCAVISSKHFVTLTQTLFCFSWRHVLFSQL